MRKLLLLLSLALLFSCNEEECSQKQISPTINENNFSVGKNDIEKVVNGYLYEPNTRSPNNTYRIISIDSINAQDIITRGAMGIKESKNLLYFVKISDGSTVVVAGDKQAEPVYAHFNNLDLKFNNGKLIEQEKIPESFLFMIGVSATSVLNRIDTEVSINSHWNLSETRSSENYGDIVPSKCFVAWGQGNPFNLKSPASNGKYADNGQAAAGCVPIAVAQALKILERYESSTDKLLPFKPIHQYNLGIRELLKHCGIDRIVTILDTHCYNTVQKPLYEVATSHTARKTFVGNLYRQVPDPNLIASMSGHVEGSRAFNRYRTIDDEMKRKLVDMIN